MVLEQLERDALQGARRRADLGQYVDAVRVFVDHPLQAADLPLDAAQSFLHGVLVVGVTRFHETEPIPPGGTNTSGLTCATAGPRSAPSTPSGATLPGRRRCHRGSTRGTARC